MDEVYQRVMLSDAAEDDERFRTIIDEAIDKGYVQAFPAYKKDTKKKRAARAKAAKAEANEAEEYAKELGVHEKLFGSKKKGKKAKGGSEDDLAALIQKRQQDRSANFLDHLAEKYGAKEKEKKKGRKRVISDDIEEEEPSEEAFQAAAARLKVSKGSKDDNLKPASRSKRSRR